MKFTFNRILRIAVAIVIGTIATVLFISVRQSQRVKDTAEGVSRTEEILYHLQELELTVLDNETGARGYVITGKNEFLDHLRRSEKDLSEELDFLKTRLTDTIAQRLLSDSIKPYVEKRIAFSQQMIAYRTENGMDAAVALVSGGIGKFYTDEIRRISAKLQQRETEILELRKKKNTRTVSQLTITLYLILALVFLLSMRIIFKVKSDVKYIIQRRKKEEELRKSEERFRLLVNNVKDYAIFMIDTDGNVESWNSGAERIKGYTSSEITGKSIDVFYTPEEIATGEPARNLALARKEGRFELQAMRVRKDGSSFWAHLVITALLDDTGKLKGYAKVTRDITEQKKNEEQFIFLSKQLDQTHDAIYVTGADRKIKTWNRGAENLYGFSKEEAIGQDANKLLQTIITPEELESLVNVLSENDYWSGELNRRTKSGREIILRSSTTTIRDDNETIIGFVSVNLDITDQKKFQQRLKQFNEELEEQVKKKTQELTTMFERITDAFVSLDKNFICSYVNKKAGTLMQREPEDVLGKSLMDVFPDLTGRSTYTAFLEAMKTQQPVINSDYYEPLDLWYELHIYPSPDGWSVFIRNITEKKKTEEKLHTAHERLMFHVEKAPLGFIEWDNKLQVRSWSKRATEIFGWTEAEVIDHQRNGISQVFEEYIPRLTVIARQLIEGDLERNIIQHKGYTKEGRLIWCEWFNSVIKDEKGRVITILSLVQDITERMRSEDELKKSFVEKRALAERMSAILNALPANIALLDEKGIIVDVNEAWKNFADGNGLLSKEYVIGTDYLATVLQSSVKGKHNGKVVTNGIQEVLNGRMDQFTYEYPCDSLEGKKWFRMIVAPQEKYGRTGAVIMHINITQQKLSEEHLRVSEQKYKLLFESNPMPMWMRSIEDKHIIDVNNAACIAYGFSKKEFLDLDPIKLRHPAEIDAFLEEFEKDMPAPTNRGVWKHKKKDDTYIDVEIYVQDIIYSGQKVRLILAKDVTERLRAEEQLRQSYDEVRRLASHLQEVREEERTKMSREIHDQLGQQLTVMKMDISWMHKKMQNAEQPIKDRMEEMKDVMDDTVKLVRRIASDLRPSLLDDMGLLAAVEWHSSEFEKRSGIKIELTGLKEEPHLSKACKISLFRIIQESMTNISRYAKAKKVGISFENQNNQFVLTVKDDGVGFDMDTISSKGTLGILGMRERTAMMGGTFKIESIPGNGTTVQVTVSVDTD